MRNIYSVASNKKIAKDTYKMVLSGRSENIKPGQFIDIQLPGFFLRRPISVCDIDKNSITIIYKAVGSGTEYMKALQNDETLDILSGLGNGFDIEKSKSKPLIIGGGVGVPPLYYLAKRLIESGKKPSVILGFNSKNEVFFKDKFISLGCNTIVTTVDGSTGIKGLVTDAISGIEYDYVFTCGPLPMLKAVYYNTDTDGQYSFEERMGCGIGACMGCTCKTKNGYKRICKDGPILHKEEIIW